MPNSLSIEACLEMICSLHVMTLATSSSQAAWSAPVYYYYTDKTFFFFSSEKSLHIKNALESKRLCAASIFQDNARFKNAGIDPPGIDSQGFDPQGFDPPGFDQPGFDQIKGIQMSGKIDRVSKKSLTLRVAKGYIKRFGLKPKSGDYLKFIETIFHAKLFCFIPDTIFFMDKIGRAHV